MDDQAQGAVASESQILDKLNERFNPPEAKPEPAQTDDANLQPSEQPETAQTEEEYQPEENAQVEGQDASQPDLSAVKVPVTYKADDGSDITEELPLDEIRSGYMRQRDYTLKTQEVSKARAAIPQAVEHGVTEARNQYTQSLAQLHALVQQTAAPELQGVNWEQLAASNPAEYVRLSARATQVQNTLQAIAAQHQAEQQKAIQAKQQSLQQEIQSSVDVLKTAIPGFSKDKYESILNGAVKEYGKYGLTHEEVAGITDAKAILVLNDALAYRALKAKQPAVQNKLAQAPIPIKPGAAKSQSDVQRARIEPLKEKLKKSGEMEDAIALYAARRKG
jgi:hypothetical protein